MSSMIINPFALGAPGGGGSPSGLSTFVLIGAEHVSVGSEEWNNQAPDSIQSGITDAHGRCYFGNGVNGRFDLGANYPSFTVRGRIRPTVNAADRVNLYFRDTLSFPQCGWQFKTDGSVEVIRGSNTPVRTSATGLWSINNWLYWEFMATVADAGSYSLKFWDDALTLLTTLAGSADMQATANAYTNFIEIGHSGSDPYTDDISFDSTGALINGPTQVETLNISGAGDLAQWPRGGTDTGNNWDQVNEAVKDTTSYVQSNAADQYDAHNIDNRAITGTPKAVQVNAIARSVSGTATFKLLLRIGGVTYEGALTQTSTTTEKKFWECWSDNPATGNAWTDAEINSLQIGYRSLATDVRIHQCCAEVLLAI